LLLLLVLLLLLNKTYIQFSELPSRQPTVERGMMGERAELTCMLTPGWPMIP